MDLFIETIKVNLLGRPSQYIRKCINDQGKLSDMQEVHLEKLYNNYEEKFVKKDMKREIKIKERRERRMEYLQHRIDVKYAKYNKESK